MSKEFNYKRAWKEHYAPAYKELPGASRNAFSEVAKLAAHVGQDTKRCELIVLNDPKDKHVAGMLAEVKKLLAEVPAEELAEALHVIYYYGHLDPHGGNIQREGLYWKFELLAKQVLLDRGKGELIYQADAKHHAINKKFMDHKEGTDLDYEEVAEKYAPLVANEFEVLKVDACNFKPHPFCIGAAHFPKDGGMYIQPKQAPCAMRGCNLSYDEHTHDVVMFVKTKKNLTDKEACAALKRITKAVEDDKVRLDGFAFAKSEFTIAKK